VTRMRLLMRGERMQDGFMRPCPLWYRQAGQIHRTWRTISFRSTFMRHRLSETARIVGLLLRPCESSPKTVTKITVRRRVYASNADRQRAYRARRAGR